MSGEESPIDEDDSEADSNTTRVQYDWSSTSPSIAIAETIATIENRPQSELEPLYEHVDPDSLDSIVRPRTSEFGGESTVSFEYYGYHVTIRSDGGICVRSDGSEPSE
ncbi:hypothetical protein A4G99_00740 [Haladaptatus sp. R4]|uniref:HalOD1 output domain-containing protein n=1 Tax=Haladaptatus sp. R4 TaxID=1679489 RepID=UPI0007B4870D|nr:HalOD1 output domain-containing protein [Haladaptatus sp. R4]KZN25095.1 hypothetical protein A4G99_00740 [Haladaptatus sp. R4]